MAHLCMSVTVDSSLPISSLISGSDNRIVPFIKGHGAGVLSPGLVSLRLMVRLWRADIIMGNMLGGKCDHWSRPLSCEIGV